MSDWKVMGGSGAVMREKVLAIEGRREVHVVDVDKGTKTGG